VRLNRRRLASLQAKLDALHPPPELCVHCGHIDPITCIGPVGAILALPQKDGTCLCWCKGCCFSFRATLRNCDNGQVIASGVEPATFPA
jgi:hypothetical protein